MFDHEVVDKLPSLPAGEVFRVSCYHRLDAPPGQQEVHVSVCKPRRVFGFRRYRILEEAWYVPELSATNESPAETVMRLAQELKRRRMAEHGLSVEPALV